MDEKITIKTQQAICLIIGILSPGLLKLEDKFYYGLGIIIPTIFFILVGILALEDKLNSLTKSKTQGGQE